MLVISYDLEVFTPPCSPGALTFSAIARLQGNIAPALPYLNAVLPNAVYNPGAPALVWLRARHSLRSARVTGPRAAASCSGEPK